MEEIATIINEVVRSVRTIREESWRHRVYCWRNPPIAHDLIIKQFEVSNETKQLFEWTDDGSQSCKKNRRLVKKPKQTAFYHAALVVFSHLP